MKLFVNRFLLHIPIFIIFGLLFLPSCKENSTDPKDNLVVDQKLVGTWELTKIITSIAGQDVELTPETAGISSTVTFNSDLTFHSTSTDSDGTTEDLGTWGTSNGNLTIHIDGDEPETTPYIILENGDVSIDQTIKTEQGEIFATLVYTKKI